jgi:uncharacterized Ntn-hydrolase superfamily protein
VTLGAGTFSIVGADPSTGEVGCAVQSKYLAIGAVTPWVRAGIGAVATQAMGVVARNGKRALSALAAKADPSEALEQALACDADPDLRQLGAVTADGRAAAYTGAGCIEWAGHLVEPGFAAQGNMLANADVLPAMRRAFLDSDAPLSERMLGRWKPVRLQAAIAVASNRLQSSSSNLAQRSDPEKALIASATCASTTIPSRSSSSADC